MNAAYINKPHYDEKGFDSWIFDEDHRMFGVFDGMGTREGARGAANLAATKFFKVRSNELDAGGLGSVIDEVSKSIAVHFPIDGTTATVTRVDSEGRLHYAHVGDSRLYVLKNGRVKQMTADEGVGNRLLNYCGPYTHGCCQIGILDADQWDKFMLCTDGITGDWKEQLMEDSYIELILQHKLFSTLEKCDELYKASKKDDDKTVIVVEK